MKKANWVNPLILILIKLEKKLKRLNFLIEPRQKYEIKYKHRTLIDVQFDESL